MLPVPEDGHGPALWSKRVLADLTHSAVRGMPNERPPLAVFVADPQVEGPVAAIVGLDVVGDAADVEAVANELGLKRIVLVGHSMGGPVSLLAAQRLSGRVVGVVCADTSHNAEFQMPEASYR